MIGNILFLVTRAVELDKGKVVPSLEGSFPNSPLEAWSVEDWDMFAEYITATADCLKRMDASATAGDMEDPTPDPERCEVPALTDKLEKILRYIKVYKITAPIRGLLMEQFKDITKTKDKLPKLPKKKVEEVWSVLVAGVEVKICCQTPKGHFRRVLTSLTSRLLLLVSGRTV